MINVNTKNQSIQSDISSGNNDEEIKNLSSIIKLAKSKKSNFAKKNSSKIEFLLFKAKKAFTYLQKAFTKAPIFWNYDLEHYICIGTNAFGYTIGDILNQMILDHWDQFFSNYLTQKNLDPSSSKSKICQ